MKQSINLDKLTLGVCYYPEHWPEELWEDDLKLMLKVGINVIRIAEFAWSKFELTEGNFSFDFFDRFMKLVKKYPEMKVIFCTPTASPPVWLTEKYPEVLNVNIDGIFYRHGMRRHYNYNSPKYREKTKIITEKIAEHYCTHPSIVGWQIDNELSCETNIFYSESDHKAFRVFLKDKYGTLDNLNNKWGTVFWNQTYTNWGEIFLSRYTGKGKTVNPHLALDEKRFFSNSAVSYCKLQYDIIKKYAPTQQFITTNGLFEHLDYDDLVGNAVDFITYSSYPNFGNESARGVNNRGFDDSSDASSPENLNDRKWSWFLSNTRVFSPNFGVMEQQSGANGWVNRMSARSPRPGQMRLWSFQSIAHGADFVSYFRWRTCTFGTEIYWHGILDYANKPNRRLTEIVKIGKDVKVATELVGSKFKAKIALVRDYDNIWDGEYDIWHGPLRRTSEVGWFNAFELTHTPFDIVYMNNNLVANKLAKYDFVVYPHATILTKKRADILKEYVAGGGSVLFGARTGYKDIYGRCPMVDMPGYVSDLCGITIDDFSMLCYKDFNQKAAWGNDELEAVVFNDILTPLSDNVKVLATFTGNYYDGAATLTEKSYGKGRAYYFGAAFNTNTAKKILLKLGFGNPYGNILDLTECCEIAVREKNGTDYIFILNYSDDATTIKLKKQFTDILTSKELSGEIVLGRYGVLILK